MKVLVINKHFEDGFGGSEIQCDIVASYLTKFGHNVVYGIVNPRKESYNVDYGWVPIGKPFWVHFGRALKSVNPDVVYWRYNKYHLLPVTLLTRNYGIPFVFHVSAISDTEHWLGSAARIFNFKNTQKGNGFLDFTKTFLWDVRQFPGTVLNYYGFYLVDAVVYQKDDDMGKLPVKRQVKIYDSALNCYKPFKWDKPFIVWIASLKSIKNPEKFIELAEHFQERNIDFLMIGTIQDPRYNYVLDKTGLPSNFHYLGVVPTNEEVNGIINSSLFLVHTCDPEPFGTIFIQAWMQGKPTISLYFDPDGTITKNQIGFVSGTMEKMVEDTEKLITDQMLRDSMGKRAQGFAVTRFSPKANVKKLENVLWLAVDR
jgi:glycosyltransferase involved in cell wall biosynthesis